VSAFGEVGKLLGAKWKEMSAGEKKVGRRAAKRRKVQRREHLAPSLTPCAALRGPSREGQEARGQGEGRVRRGQRQEAQEERQGGCRVSVARRDGSVLVCI
jgi:hypothetical protein